MKVRILVFLKVIVSALLIYGFSSVKAQVTSGSLSSNQQNYPDETLYLQTDRSTYEQGEIIWFKTYVIQNEGSNANQTGNKLLVTLVDRDSLEILRKVFRIENNQVSGNIEIPAKVTSGNYMLVALTSSMSIYPSAMYFAKEIIIDNEDNQGLMIDIKLKDTISQPGSQLTAYLKFRSKDSLAVSTPFSYRLNNMNGTITTGNGKTDKAGEALITVTLPALEPKDNLTLFVEANYKRTKAGSGILVPTPDNYLQVQFYPESGGLIYGADSKIVFRGFNAGDKAVDFKGEIITNEGTIVKKIESSYKGIGDFQLTPEEGKRYQLRITQPSGITKTFNLPVPQNSGAVVLFEGIKQDTLILDFNQLNQKKEVYKFTARMRGEIYWTASTEVTKHALIKLACNDFPSGLLDFEAVDADGKLVARRLFFINEEEGLNIKITKVKEQYTFREQVTFDIMVSDENGNPVKANLSLSAINSNLYSQPDNYNMRTYSDMKNELFGSLQIPQFYFTNSDISKEQLDNLVIINASGKDNTLPYLSTSKSDISLRNTGLEYDTIGIFSFTRNDAAFFSRYLNNDQKTPGKVYTVQEKNNLLKISKPETKQTISPEYDLSRSVADIIFTIKPYQISNGQIVFRSSGPNSINSQQGAIIVVNGILKGTNPSVLDDISAADIKDINVSTNPVDIQRYSGFNSMGVIEITTKNGSAANTITKSDLENGDLSKPGTTFQSPGYEKSETNGKQKLDFRKTIYWNSDIMTDETGKATISYYNSDIASEILINVQGISSSGFFGRYSTSYLVK